MALSLWHIRTARMPPTFDDAWYLEVSYRLFHALREGRLAEFGSLYANAFRLKAPLISVLPLPFYVLFGPSQDAACLVNLAALAALGWYVFRLGTRLGGEAVGALAVALAMTFPMLAGLSRRFL